MIHDWPSALPVATFSALLLTTLALWFGARVWMPVFLIAIGLGYVSGAVSGLGALWIIVLCELCLWFCHFKRQPRNARNRAGLVSTFAGIVVVCLLLGTHTLPGFNNLLVAENLVISPGAAPYTLYLNFDKATVGILLLGLIHQQLMSRWAEWREALQAGAPILLLTVVVLMACSLAVGYVQLDPKWHSLFWIWAASNLLLTCLSEEAFFRGFIQRELFAALEGRTHAHWIAISVSAVLFGLAHIAGGWTYVALAALAGFGYAVVCQRTGRVEMAMLTHFSLNATHFLLFTYPRVS